MYEERSFEVSLPDVDYCDVIRVLWTKSDDVFAIYFVNEQEIQTNFNPYINNINFIRPMTLRFNKVNMLHRGLYKISVLYAGSILLHYSIRIDVIRIGGWQPVRMFQD